MDKFFKHRYYNTYYYANIINNILTGDFDFIGFISRFFEPEGTINYLAEPFQKKSAFHSFIEHIVAEFFDDDMHEKDSSNYDYSKIDSHYKFVPYADDVLKEYGFNNYGLDETINDYSDIEKYHTEIYESGILLDLFEIIAEEVFYIMFNNRQVLLQFNYIVAQHMDMFIVDNVEYEEDEEYKELRKLFTKKGYLKRVRIPEWSKKAVFFRDRGRCCFCHEDLSGTLSINSKKHYDHIIPLVQGGLNDVANIQLLCSSCNANKGGAHIKTSDLYERWF